MRGCSLRIVLLAAVIGLCACWKLSSSRPEFRKKVIASWVAAASLNTLEGAAQAKEPDVIRSCGNTEFSLSYIGSGGSGTVFKGIPTRMRGSSGGNGDPKIIKVSRSASEAGVRKEASLIKELNENGVENIEKFVTSCESMKVREDADGFAIVLEPYLNPPEAPSIASIKDDESGIIKAKTSRALMKTCIQFIASNVYLTDLQILVEPGATGRMLVIDLTEAERLHLGDEKMLSFRDKTAMTSFLGECISFVEEAVANAHNEEVANMIKTAALEGIKEGVDSSPRKERLSPEVLEVIQDYSSTRLLR